MNSEKTQKPKILVIVSPNAQDFNKDKSFDNMTLSKD